MPEEMGRAKRSRRAWKLQIAVLDLFGNTSVMTVAASDSMWGTSCLNRTTPDLGFASQATCTTRVLDRVPIPRRRVVPGETLNILWSNGLMGLE
jgi:hypothetical protein